MKIRIKAAIKLSLGMLLMISGFSMAMSIKPYYPLWSLGLSSSSFIIGMGFLFIFTKTAFEEIEKEQEEQNEDR